MRKALLLTVLVLLGGSSVNIAQRMETTSLKPIASTPQPGEGPRTKDEGQRTRDEGPGTQPAIATTRPLVAPPPPAALQPAATWPTPARPTTPALLPAFSPMPGSQAVGLLLEKTDPPSVERGKPYTYEIIVRNSCALPTHQVRVEDQLPAGARYLGGEPRPREQGDRLVWDVGTLEPGAERRFKVELQAGGEGDLSSGATATFSTRNKLPTRGDRPKLALTVTVPETVAVARPVALQMKIANTGTGAAANVIVHDTLPAGLKHPEGTEVEADLGTLAAGETKTLTLEAMAAQPGKLVNQASVRADGVAPVIVETTVTVASPALGVWLSGPLEPTAGREVEYTAEAANTGTGPASEARVSVILPAGMEFVSAGEGGAYQASIRQVDWPLGTLTGGQSRRVAMKLRWNEPGERTLQAVFKAEHGQEAKVDMPIRVGAKPALLLEVADLSDPVKLGAEAIYEIRVLNQSGQVTTGLRLMAKVPEGLTVVDVEGPTSHRREEGAIIFEQVKELVAGADLLYRVRAKATRLGDWRFQASVASEQLQPAISQEESTRVVPAEAGETGQTPAGPQFDGVKK